ncbi:hypothetical protein DCAR_0206058 [Daucus carota subsp. sativus]|uniref:Uncharacterized protein n=1 Tax=Daucus carota subsp. sativus TaxID=79200 RepID=A0A161Y5F9_DAUCS|nr:hypothetical protein DCAR_0206058 [Daucus carota subsp. sativus]
MYVCMYRFSVTKIRVRVFMQIIIEGKKRLKDKGVLSYKDTNPDPTRHRSSVLFLHLIFFACLLVGFSTPINDSGP